MIKDKIKNLRLQSIFELLSRDLVLADIGTDHAYLPVHYAISYPKSKCYAADIGVEPLNSAIKNIEQYDCQNQVFPILSNGLENVPDDASGLVIAGMGVDTIIEILDQSKNKWSQFKQIVLQPNLKVERLRKYLIENGFKIVNEICVEDKGKYYIVLDTVSATTSENYSVDEINCGKFLKYENSSVYWDYCLFRMNSLKKAIDASTERNPEHYGLYQSYTRELEWREKYGNE